MGERLPVRGVVPYVFCVDAAATADWCVAVLGFEERGRWSNSDDVVTNVELVVGDNEVWLDGPVPNWRERLDGLGCWIGLLVDDVDVVYRDLRARGHDPGVPVDREFGIRQLSVSDPEGHQWGFFTRTS